MRLVFLKKNELRHKDNSKLQAFLGFPQSGDDRSTCSTEKFSVKNCLIQEMPGWSKKVKPRN